MEIPHHNARRKRAYKRHKIFKVIGNHLLESMQRIMLNAAVYEGTEMYMFKNATIILLAGNHVKAGKCYCLRCSLIRGLNGNQQILD